MTRILFTFLFSTMLCNSFSQTDWELNTFNFNLEIVKQYPDSLIKFQYTYDKPKKIIYEWYFWVDTVLHHTKGGYNGKLLDGAYEKFDANGNMLVQGKFQRGLKNWEWKYWNSSGELIRVENWTNGKKNGLVKYYNSSGNILKEVNYKDGYLSGYTIIYSSDSIVSKKRFKKGELMEGRVGFFNGIFKKKT